MALVVGCAGRPEAPDRPPTGELVEPSPRDTAPPPRALPMGAGDAAAVRPGPERAPLAPPDGATTAAADTGATGPAPLATTPDAADGRPDAPCDGAMAWDAASPSGDAADLTKVDPLPANPAVELVRDGYTFTEGPLWLPSGALIFSDLPAGVLWKYTPPSSFERFHSFPPHNVNGTALAPDGSVIICGQAGRRLWRKVGAAAPVVLAERWPGGDGTRAGRLNSPNDAVVRSDGTIYFTDPIYGVAEPDRELGFHGVFRLDPRGTLSLVARDGNNPNGILLSPDERKLYVTNTSPPQIRRFSVNPDGSTRPDGVWVQLAEASDGMAIDDAGNVYTTQASGVNVYGPDGRRRGVIRVPQQPANATFGGADRRTLFITARRALYRVRLNIPGKPQ
jgi:gluconolactonase